MSLFKFQEHIYLEYKKNWFLWESAWEKFRPIISSQWTGTSFLLDDTEFCKDPLDPLYGYGSLQMKQVCDVLTQKYSSQISQARRVSSLECGKLEWFFDRRMSLTACCPRTKDAWKGMVRGKYRTLRRGNAVKFTRRNRYSS